MWQEAVDDWMRSIFLKNEIKEHLEIISIIAIMIEIIIRIFWK